MSNVGEWMVIGSAASPAGNETRAWIGWVLSFEMRDKNLAA
jgi:hypothetical protein